MDATSRSARLPPPQNDIYQLVEPIDLEDINNPGPVLATINSFPVTVNPPAA